MKNLHGQFPQTANALSFCSPSTWPCFLALTILSFVACGCGSVSPSEEVHIGEISGLVHGGQQPVTGSLIQLYAVGASGDGSTSTALITATVTTSDGSGNATNSNANAGNGFNSFPAGGFTISNDYHCPSATTEVYLTSVGGNPGLVAGTNNSALSMMAVLGQCGNLTASTYVFVDELTTVASLAPLASYMSSYSALGSASADATEFVAALAEVNEYTNTAVGTVPGPALPAGYYASSIEIQTLGDVLAGCINSAGGVAGDGSFCGHLFTLTTPSGGTAPTDTIGAMLNILKYPTLNTCSIFGLASATGPYQPTLQSCPTTWNLPIVPQAATPVIAPATGNYVGTQNVTITDSTASSTIYYTTNGTTPTTSSSVYSAAFQVSSTTTVQAIAIAAGYATSGIATSTLSLTAAGNAAQLAFITPPVNTAISTDINPSVQVAVEDIHGNIVTNATNPVTIAIGTNPAAGNLSGTLVQTPTNGIATFSNLQIDTIASGYTLVASSAPLTPATSATFGITPYPITLNASGPLVGVGSTLPGTFTLSHAAPTGGLTVNLASSDTTIVTISPSSVNVAAGGTTGSFTYVGVKSGTASLTASGGGYLAGSASVTATSSLISMGQIPTVSLGQSTSLALSLGVAAPSGGLTVSFASSNPSVATVTPSVFIPAGFQIPVENPQITGVSFGSTTVTASAPGFASDIRNISVSLTASFPATASIPLTTPTPVTLTLSAPAPAGGLTFTLSSDSPAIATVPTSVTVAANSNTASVPITGVSGGTTTIRADYPGVAEATVAVTVAGTINVGATTTGAGVYVSKSVSLSSTPPNPVTVTITSNNPAVALLSTNAATAGTPSISFSNVTTTIPTFYIQGQAAGSTTISVAATGYTTTTGAVTVDPVGLVLNTASFSTTTFSATTPVSVYLVLLDPVAFTVSSYCGLSISCYMNPGASASISLTSATTTVGTVTSPIVVPSGAFTASSTFTPTGPGSTTLTLGAQPAGFTTPAGAVNTPITATVTAPQLAAISATTGAGVYVSTNFSLPQTPPNPVTVTVTVSNPAVAVLSTNAAVLGTSGTLVFNTISSSVPTFYIQGLTAGSTTVTVSAPGFTSSTTGVITVDPVSLVLYTANFSTTTFSSTTNVGVYLVILNPTTLNPLYYCGLSISCYLNPGINTSIPLTSSNTAVGTVTSPLTFAAGSFTANSTFTPTGTGTTTLTLGAQPAGFTTPTAGTTNAPITATVSAPQLSAISGTTGTGVYIPANFSLPLTPPSPVTVTITLSNPAVAVLSTNAAVLGTSGTLVFNNISGAVPTFYIQGLTAGSTTVTVSAPGFTSSTTGVITVDPVGLTLYTANFSTTTFSATTGISVYLVILNPSTLNPLYYCGLSISCYLNPGTGPFNIALTSSNTTVGTVTSPITFTAGSFTASSTFTPVGAGTATITLGAQPSGFTAAANSTGTLSATVTAPQLAAINATTGAGVYIISSGFSLPQTPPNPVTVTVTIANPAVAVFSTGSGVLGSNGTLTFTNITGSVPTFYIQGLTAGSTTITVSAPGYINSTGTITVDPVSLVLYTANFSTTTFSSTTNVGVYLVILNPTTLNPLYYCGLSISCYLNPGTSTSISLTSSNTAVGTVTSPLTFAAGSFVANSTFTPTGAGTTTLTLGAQPAGFTTPAGTTNAPITATVTAPQLAAISATTGAGVYVSSNFSLPQTPPSPVAVTVTLSNPSVAVLSTNASVLGTGGTLVFNNVTGSVPTFYIQGLTAGSTTVTVSAPGFTSNTTGVVTVDPVTLELYTANFSTTTFSSTTNVGVYLVVLNPSTLNPLYYCGLSISCYFNPGTSTSISLTSSNTAVGTLTSPLTFTAGSFVANSTFTPTGAGTTTITLGTEPAGFTNPAPPNNAPITATVTAPQLAALTATTGAGVYVSSSFSLPQTPPSPVAVTITLSNPSVAVLSTNSSVLGSSGTLVFNSITGSVPAFYIQGLAAGSTTVTVSAPGFTSSTTGLITVDPSGFVFSTASFSTTTQSATTPVGVYLAVLNPTTLNVLYYCGLSISCYLNPGNAQSIALSSSLPGIGTITTPMAFPAGSYGGNATFTPLGAGATTLSIPTQPTGFTGAANNPSVTSITATVTAPSITTVGTAVATGYDLEVPQKLSLSVAPAAGLTITITSSNPAIALVSNSPTTTGTTFVTIPGVTGTTQQQVYIQGIAQGNANLTISAPGYTSAILPITVSPSGFIIQATSFSTTTTSPDTLIAMYPAVLDSGLNYITSAQINPQSSTLSMALTSSNTAAGTVLVSPLTFQPGDTVETFTFHPIGSGTTNITVGAPPAGFSTPSSLQQITATVN